MHIWLICTMQNAEHKVQSKVERIQVAGPESHCSTHISFLERHYWWDLLNSIDAFAQIGKWVSPHWGNLLWRNMIFKMESQMLLNGLVGLSSFGSWVGTEVTSVNFFWKLNLVLTRRRFVVKSRQNMHVGMQLKPLVSAMGVYIISPRHYNSGGECFNNWKPLRIQQWGPVCLY